MTNFSLMVSTLKQNIARAVVGKDDVVELMLTALLCEGHVLIEDVPGVGKTTLASALARSLSCSFKRIQFTPDITPSDITGFTMPSLSGDMQYRPGAIMSQIVLADEINRTSPKTQSALLEVMEERQVTVDGVTHPLPVPFAVIATQNPVGSAGTQLLPQAQLDRFMVRLEMGYPDFESQVNILRDRQQDDPLTQVREVSSAEALLEMQRQAQSVHMADPLLEYVTRLTEATRAHPLVLLGVSPRGALAVCRMAKSRAFMHGRDYVLPEDVQSVFIDVCAHRLFLAPKANISDTTAADVLTGLLEQVRRPDHI